MKTFVQTLYDYKFTGTVIEEENSDDEDEIIVINESDSQTVNNCTQPVGYSDSDGNNIPILNDENEIEIVLITE